MAKTHFLGFGFCVDFAWWWPWVCVAFFCGGGCGFCVMVVAVLALSEMRKGKFVPLIKVRLLIHIAKFPKNPAQLPKNDNIKIKMPSFTDGLNRTQYLMFDSIRHQLSNILCHVLCKVVNDTMISTSEITIIVLKTKIGPVSQLI